MVKYNQRYFTGDVTKRLKEIINRGKKPKVAQCTECGKLVTTIQEMIDHYKEHPEVKVISGDNELEVMEQLKENEEK